MKKIFGFGKKKKRDPSPNTSDAGSVLSLGYELKDKDLSKLHRAASTGDVSKIKQLIKKQDTNQLDKENRTPLHIACANGHLDAVKLLLESKSKLNLCDNDNRSPLLKAIQCQQESCAAVLLEHNADPNLVDINGNAALHLAALIPSVSIAKQLLEHGANINATNKEGCTPLILAVTENNDEIVEFLLKEGADVNACDRSGRTSLMISSNNGQNNLVRMLLQHEADINIKDEKGWTADDYGVMNGHHACSHLIIEHGSKKRQNMSPCYGSNINRDTSIFNTPNRTGEIGCSLVSPATNKKDHSQVESESCVSDKSGDVDSWPSSDEDNDDIDFCPQKTPKPSLTQLLEKKKHDNNMNNKKENSKPHSDIVKKRIFKNISNLRSHEKCDDAVNEDNKQKSTENEVAEKFVSEGEENEYEAISGQCEDEDCEEDSEQCENKDCEENSEECEDEDCEENSEECKDEDCEEDSEECDDEECEEDFEEDEDASEQFEGEEFKENSTQYNGKEFKEDFEQCRDEECDDKSGDHENCEEADHDDESVDHNNCEEVNHDDQSVDHENCKEVLQQSENEDCEDGSVLHEKRYCKDALSLYLDEDSETHSTQCEKEACKDDPRQCKEKECEDGLRQHEEKEQGHPIHVEKNENGESSSLKYQEYDYENFKEHTDKSNTLTDEHFAAEAPAILQHLALDNVSEKTDKKNGTSTSRQNVINKLTFSKRHLENNCDDDKHTGQPLKDFKDVSDGDGIPVSLITGLYENSDENVTSLAENEITSLTANRVKTCDKRDDSQIAFRGNLASPNISSSADSKIVTGSNLKIKGDELMHGTQTKISKIHQDSSNADDENSDFEESVERSPIKANVPSLSLSGETYSKEKLQDVEGPAVRKVELMSELGLEEDDIESPWDSESASESSRKQVVSDLPLPAAKTHMQCISEESNEEFSEKSAPVESKQPKLLHGALQKSVSSRLSVAKDCKSTVKSDLMDDLGLDDADDIEDASDWDSASLSPKYTMPHQRTTCQVQNRRDEILPRTEAPLPTVSAIIPPVPLPTELKPDEDDQSTTSEDEFNSTNNAVPELPNYKEDSLKEIVEKNTVADQKGNNQYENSQTQSEQLKKDKQNLFSEESQTISGQHVDIHPKLDSVKGMKNIMRFGDNKPSNEKFVLDGKLAWKQMKNTTNGDPLEVFDDSTLSDTSQEEDGRVPGKFTSENNKLDNAGELEDFSPSSDTATEEFGTPTLPFRNAKLLIEQLSADSQDSVNVLKFQNIIHEYERTIQRENGRYKLLARKVRKMENEKKDLQQIGEKNRELKSMLDHQKVEWESDLNSLRFTLKQEEEKRKNAEMLYDKSQEQLRRKEDLCCKEMEAKQLLELTIRNLELELRSMQNNVKQVEEERNEVQRILSHEHNARIAQEDVLNKIRKKSEEAENQKMWTKTADGFGQLSKIDEREKDLNLQNANLQEEINVLKLEMDHVQSRNQQEEIKYMDENENLKEQIADLRRDLKMNEETLTQTVIQYNSQLHALKTENTMLCSKLEHEKQGKDRLETELESIRSRLTSTLQEVEKNQTLKIDVERTLQRDRDEWLRSQDKLNYELSNIRENNNNLSQQLSRAEAKSNGLENELRQANMSLQDKVIHSESAQRELTQACGRIKELEHTLQLEKDKVCKSTVKQESLQEKLAQIQSDNMLLRQQIEDVNNKGIIKDRTVSDVQDKFTEIVAKLRADAERQVQIIEERNKDLIIKYNEIREQLYRLETEKVERESTLRQLQQELADAFKKLSMSEASLEVITRYRNDIEGEKQLLQKEVEKFKTKVQDLEEQCIQAERLHHQLKILLEDKEREVFATSQKVQEYSSAATGAENAIKELEGHIQKLEIENAKIEAIAKQQAGQIDILQKELQETLSIRHKLEELMTSLQSSKMGLEEKLNHQVHKQTALSQSAQDSHNLWEEELKSRSRLGIRLAELEQEKAEFADQVENEKKKMKKLMEHKRSMEARFDQEMTRNTDLQQEIARLKKLLKTAKKKIKELESGGIQHSTPDGFKSTHFEKESDILKLNEKIHELSFRLENESSSYKQLESANRDLQQQLSSMKIFHKSQEHLENGKRQLEDEVANLKRQIEINKVDQSLIEKHKREIEERGRQELRQKLEEVNLFLQSQAASQETLEQLRAANDASVRNQVEHRIQELESELHKIKNVQQESMLQKESTQTELERFKELYNEELKNRNSLAVKLERANERLADANAKLLTERQRTKSLIASSIMNGSLATSPVADVSHFGNLSNSGFRLGGSFLSSTANGLNTNRVESYLTKMQQELEKNITKELDQANAELETGSSARVSPVGSIAGSLRNLNVDQDPVSRATQQYLEVLKKNNMI
ncbi:ankyrin repeat domain-containing protein 26 isoform X3 [Xenopus laevis]|uniref:Ankyrin repeat domain-containing protein 26 isoform X3 n=1 Tax=Xenopus laevis TaxID=8355 RepID=A0A8J0UR51_XENLA|nr:ankyrin repeat domain-containing protein 26 isoform X3 [Xenopus laevis]